MNVKQARIMYLEQEYDPIPLKPGTKEAAAHQWQKRPTLTQWNGQGDDVNIGLRAGNGRAFIDADDKNKPGTSTNVTNWLSSLGHTDYPVITTPNHGLHIYTTFAGTMLGSVKKLKPDMGAGEFRYGPGAFVAAYPSVIVGEGMYEIVSGDIARPLVLDLKDISTLIDINAEPERERKTKRMSPSAYAIAHGTKPDKYASDSEGEAALVLSLHNSGYNYEEIKAVFNTFPCLGHYKNKHAGMSEKEANRWLFMTWQNALAYSRRESPVRRLIGQWIQQARAAAWSNANRRKVLIAHLEKAYQPARLEYNASLRDLALAAGVQLDAATNQTRKLEQDGFIKSIEPGTPTKAKTYSLMPERLTEALAAESVSIDGQRKPGEKLSHHDAFRNGGGRFARGRLGRRAGEIYELLTAESLTAEQIATRTGAHVKTVRRALHKMQCIKDYRTGEVIEMVSCSTAEGETWSANLVDLDLIAAILRTYGATGRQQAQYEKERRANLRALELSQLDKDEHILRTLM